MGIGFAGFGICTRCGDTQGPWGWDESSGWLCDNCAREKSDEKIFIKTKDDDVLQRHGTIPEGIFKTTGK